MPVERNSRNNPSKQGLGNPGDSGQDKASIKDIKGTEEDDLQQEEELREKYGDETEGVDPDTLRGSHPNRNTDKTDSPGPAYS